MEWSHPQPTQKVSQWCHSKKMPSALPSLFFRSVSSMASPMWGAALLIRLGFPKMSGFSLWKENPTVNFSVRDSLSEGPIAAGKKESGCQGFNDVYPVLGLYSFCLLSSFHLGLHCVAIMPILFFELPWPPAHPCSLTGWCFPASQNPLPPRTPFSSGAHLHMHPCSMWVTLGNIWSRG